MTRISDILLDRIEDALQEAIARMEKSDPEPGLRTDQTLTKCRKVLETIKNKRT